MVSRKHTLYLATAAAFFMFGSQAKATFTGLGQAANFAVLGLPNTNLNFSNDTVTGNVGLSGSATLTNMAPSTINGDIYRESTTTVNNAGTITGATHIQSMTSINNDATNASSQDGALTPTQTFSTITTGTTITGNGGLNVIKINDSITLGDSQNLILSGNANDIFVVNILGTLTATGSSQLGLSGGVTASHVLYNFIGPANTISLQVGNSVFGTMLGPNYSITNGDGAYHGGMIFGGDQIKLLSGATVENIPFAVPEPGSLALLGVGTLAALGKRRRKQS